MKIEALSLWKTLLSILKNIESIKDFTIDF